MTHVHCHARGRLVGAATVIALASLAPAAHAQTDYYNTDAGRPVQIEDAYPVERRAFEIQLAPLRLERARGGVYRWGIEPEIAFGILPRTQIELGVPFAFIDAGSGNRTSGVAGVDLSVLHNLNVETSIPALALSAGVLLPAGGLGPDEARASLKAIMTRTFTGARLHINAQYTFGDRLPELANDVAGEDAAVASASQELSRWLAGVAVDRTLPLSSLLVTGEVYAREPLRSGEDLEWNTGAGVRYQLGPRFNIDGGIGRRLTGDDRGWYATFGTAFAFGLPWHP
ncbi:MAG: hypothetical protein ACREON_13710 [Gemmatimonadaceae bacterium]